MRGHVGALYYAKTDTSAPNGDLDRSPRADRGASYGDPDHSPHADTGARHAHTSGSRP